MAMTYSINKTRKLTYSSMERYLGTFNLQITIKSVKTAHKSNIPNLTGSDPKMVLCGDYTFGWASFYSSINQNQQVCLSIFLRAAK